MKRLKDKSIRIAKKMMTVVVCLSVMASMPAGITSVNATEVSQSGDTAQSTTTTEAVNTDANGTLGKNSDVGISVTKSITGKAGKSVNVAFTLKSNDPANIRLKGVYPVIDDSFPFETSGDAYKVVSAGSDSDKQAKLSAAFKMKVRSDIETGYHSVRFIGEYSKTESDGTTEDYYVIKTINIYFEGTAGSSGNISGGGSLSGSGDDDDTPDSGDDDSGVYSLSDNGDNDSDDSSAPKLIITGYDTKPEKIMAGETFTITIHIQNTSKTTSVCNGKFLVGNEAGNFLPTSGSSAVFVESIPAGKTGDIKIEMKTSSDLAQKNYILVVKGDFDDGKGNNYTYSDNLYLPVFQEVKLGITDVSMSPEAIGIDSEGTLMFTINNQGNAGVYNVNVSVKDDAVTCEDSYVGNIAASSSAYATLNLVGVQDNSETGTINVVISYEDSEGNTGTMEQAVTCMVGEDVSMDNLDFDGGDLESDFYEEDMGLPIWLIVIIVLIVIAAITGVIVFIVIRKKKKMAELLADEDGEDDLEDEDF